MTWKEMSAAQEIGKVGAISAQVGTKKSPLGGSKNILRLAGK